MQQAFGFEHDPFINQSFGRLPDDTAEDAREFHRRDLQRGGIELDVVVAREVGFEERRKLLVQVIRAALVPVRLPCVLIDALKTDD